MKEGAMLDLAGTVNFEQQLAEDSALHAEVASIAAFVERLGEQGRGIDTISVAELRSEGLSNEATEFVINATPAEIRSVIGTYAAFIIKMRHGGPA
jgi:hypothetical protein